jgi:hypothetical protein
LTQKFTNKQKRSRDGKREPLKDEIDSRTCHVTCSEALNIKMTKKKESAIVVKYSKPCGDSEII